MRVIGITMIVAFFVVVFHIFANDLGVKAALSMFGIAFGCVLWILIAVYFIAPGG